MDIISTSDLSLFSKAQTGLQIAQDRLQFVTTHLGETYQITPQDQVDLKTGVITRFKAPEEPPQV